MQEVSHTEYLQLGQGHLSNLSSYDSIKIQKLIKGTTSTFPYSRPLHPNSPSPIDVRQSPIPISSSRHVGHRSEVSSIASQYPRLWSARYPHQPTFFNCIFTLDLVLGQSGRSHDPIICSSRSNILITQKGLSRSHKLIEFIDKSERIVSSDEGGLSYPIKQIKCFLPGGGE